MNAKKCDRCKKFYEKNKWKTYHGYYISGIKIMTTNSMADELDLCDECLKDLHKFAYEYENGRETYVWHDMDENPVGDENTQIILYDSLHDCYVLTMIWAFEKLQEDRYTHWSYINPVPVTEHG